MNRALYGYLLRAACVAGLGVVLLSNVGESIGQIRKDGSEFQVNSYTEYPQEEPRLDTAGAKRFLVAWVGPAPTGREYGIRGQLFERDGRRVGVEFPASPFSDRRNEDYPAVCRSSNDGFILAWDSLTTQTESRIDSQKFTASAAVDGASVTVNSSAGSHSRSSIAADAQGNFVVAWIDRRDGEQYAPHLRIRKFYADGTPATDEFGETIIGGLSRDTSVAMQPDGGFIVVWQEDGVGIIGKQFDAEARPGPVFSVTPLPDRYPEITTLANGEFVVVWQSYGQDGSGYAVIGQRYSGDAQRLGGRFQVNTYSPDHQAHPSVAADAAGDFVVVWESYASLFETEGGQDGSGRGVFGQVFGPDGRRVGREFQVNTFTAGDQGVPSIRESDVAMWPNGDFVATWTSQRPEDESRGVFAQRFGFDSALNAVCGDASNSDLVITSRDALFILRGAVDLRPCEACLCDADGSEGISVADALLSLKRAVGLPVVMSCPPCANL